ncbi:hypothetical protein ACWEQ7_02840 [Streptomyces sp. NPDC004069]
MICLTCANAADQQLGEDQHCGTQAAPGAVCFCQHRTDRYRTPTPAAAQQTTVVIHVHPTPVRIPDGQRDARRARVGRV